MHWRHFGKKHRKLPSQNSRCRLSLHTIIDWPSKNRKKLKNWYLYYSHQLFVLWVKSKMSRKIDIILLIDLCVCEVSITGLRKYLPEQFIQSIAFSNFVFFCFRKSRQCEVANFWMQSVGNGNLDSIWKVKKMNPKLLKHRRLWYQWEFPVKYTKVRSFGN